MQRAAHPCAHLERRTHCRELVGVAERDREPLLRGKVASTHVGDGTRHDRSHLLAIEAADAQGLARLDLTRRARELVATLMAEAQLPVHALRF
jgi:hypothetical protein